MKRLFQIKVFIFLFSLSGFSTTTSCGYHLRNTDRIELLEIYHSPSIDTLKSINLYSIDNKKNRSNYSLVLEFNALEVLRLQSLLYQSIKNTLEITYIISHQTNTLPQYLIN